MVTIGIGTILAIFGVGVLSAIKEGEFMKHPERMNMTNAEIAQIKAIERQQKEFIENLKNIK